MGGVNKPPHKIAMPTIHDQLKEAQLENVTGSDPSNLPSGKIWIRTDTGDVKVRDSAATRTLVDTNREQTLTNKSINSDDNTITNIKDADIKSDAAIARNKLASGGANHVVINSGAGVLSSEAQLAISRGGTGAATANAGFNALSPMTTKGDIISFGSTAARLPVGSNGQVLTADSGEALGVKWANPGTPSAPTVQKFLSTGTTAGWFFNISTTTTCAAGDTYTNNGNTYTVLYALSAQSGWVFMVSGASAPQTSGTLTRATGSGTASVTFTARQALAVYTTPSSPITPVYLKVTMVGGGGGGGGGSTHAAPTGGNGSDGNPSSFGQAVAFGGAGGAGSAGTGAAGGDGGVTTLGITTELISGLEVSGGCGGAVATIKGDAGTSAGGTGGASALGGAGRGRGGGAAGVSGLASTGGGGGGGSGSTSNSNGSAPGGGGGAGGYISGVITSPAASYYYSIGSGGVGGSAGGGGAGGGGGSGVVIVEEFYQ